MNKLPLLAVLMLMSSLAALWNSTGGTCYADGAYTACKFTANGSFNVTGTITNASVLVVAGGGAGGERHAGGGGGGGYIFNTTMADLIGNYTVVVGAGGIGSSTSGENTAGQNSSFGTLLNALGGGKGGGQSAGTTGGSGGGGGLDAGYAGLAGQGYAGGGGYEGSTYNGGAGGGCNQIGNTSTTTYLAIASVGCNNSISNSSINYSSGGGGGGYYLNTVGTNGSPNTGTGGGGCGGNLCVGGNGSTGIVIIKYLTYTAPATVPPNVTFYIQTSTPQYNGTMVNFTFKGVFWNPTEASQTLNLTVTANGTTAATATNAVLAAGNITELNGNWTGQRATLDANFSIGATATNPNGTLSATNLTMLLPIDPPSAINLMASGGKDRCRTPQQIGYWDARNWTINASWGCNYTDLNLTRNITYADSGTTTFTNSNITSNWFNRLIGNAGTAAIFIFKTSVLRIKGGV